MTTLGTLASGVQNLLSTRKSEVYLTELNDEDRPSVDTDGLPSNKRFQYFPESLSDTKAVTYTPKEIFGATLPLYQYVGSGERVVSFTAIFTTDIDHLVDAQVSEMSGVANGSTGDQRIQLTDSLVTSRLGTLQAILDARKERLRSSGALARNPFIPGALIWLRRFLFPRYSENSRMGMPLTKPPHQLLLHLPGTQFEMFGGTGGFSVVGGGMLCRMTQCDITIEAMFPSGNIRAATVSLSFSESAQQAGAIRFPSASGMDQVARDQYWLDANGGPNSGGRSR